MGAISRRIIGFLFLIAVGFAWGIGVGHYHVFPFEQFRQVRSLFQSEPEPEPPSLEDKYYGRWHPIRGRGGAAARSETMEELGALPYLQGYHSPKSDSSGVVTRARGALNGYTLFSSGHAPLVYMIDMDGDLVHSWSIQFAQVWPDSLPFPVRKEHTQFIRRAYLYPNGDLLAVFEYIGVVKLDRDSKILWSYTGRNHHDLYVARSGNIYTLGVERRSVQPDIAGSPFVNDYILDDVIIVLDAEGREVDRISVFDAFYQSEYAGYLNVAAREYDDVFHTNSVQLIERTRSGSRLFGSGDILISMRNIDTIASIGADDRKIKWAMSGMWRAQHQATFLRNGHILLLDNQGANRDSYFQFDRSRVIELNPSTQRIAWAYDPGDGSFFTHWLGFNQRLRNGNTLITESTQGHILEVTQDMEIVWEYYNPNRTGANHELIATIMGATRINPANLNFVDRN